METLDLLKELLSEVTSKEITLDKTLKDLGLDSLDVVEVLLKVEEELNITFDDEELIGLNTVEDVVALINTKK